MTTASDLINMQIAVKDTKNTIRERLGKNWVVSIHLDDCFGGDRFWVSVFKFSWLSNPIKVIKFLIRDDDCELVEADEMYTAKEIDKAAQAISKGLRVTYKEVA